MKKIIIIGTLLCSSVLLSTLAYASDRNTLTNNFVDNNLASMQSEVTQLPGVNFSQVDYLWKESSFENSSTGEIIVDVELLKASTGLLSGYINVYSDQGWIVENLPILEDYPYQTIATYFDLGGSGDVTNIDVYMEASNEPTERFPDGPRVSYPVSDSIFNGEGDIGRMNIPRTSPPAPGIDDFVPGDYTFNCTQPLHPNVQAADMQCVPACYANNLQYLENEFGNFIPHDHIPGINAMPQNSLVGQLDVKMKRSSVDRTNGSGTDYENGIRGLLNYSYFESVMLEMRHQGLEGDKDYNYEGYFSFGQGATITFDFIQTEFCQGNALGLLYRWYAENGSYLGGHMVQAIAVGKILGVPYIIKFDDTVQTDKDPLDQYGVSTPHLRYLIDTNDDGRFNVVKDPESPDGSPELVAVVVLDSFNEPPEQPSPPLGPLTLKKEIEYEFTTTSTDPNGHPIWYFFDWGDGADSGWVGPFNSGEKGSATHIWEENGFYKVRVKARDSWGAESDWSKEQLKPVPGFEMVILIAGIVIAFIIWKRKK